MTSHPFFLFAFFAAASALHADTLDTIANPEALRQSIPRLHDQPQWTDFATPGQIKLFDGPPTVWPVIPDSAYDLAGFDPASIGSALPPVGVHPRLLFSPEDVPALARSFRGGDKLPTIAWDAARDTATLQWPDQHDELVFARDASDRTLLTVRRDGADLLSSR